jgi:hypothetical protein
MYLASAPPPDAPKNLGTFTIQEGNVNKRVGPRTSKPGERQENVQQRIQIDDPALKDMIPTGKSGYYYSYRLFDRPAAISLTKGYKENLFLFSKDNITILLAFPEITNTMVKGYLVHVDDKGRPSKPRDGTESGIEGLLLPYFPFPMKFLSGRVSPASGGTRATNPPFEFVQKYSDLTFARKLLFAQPDENEENAHQNLVLDAVEMMLTSTANDNRMRIYNLREETKLFKEIWPEEKVERMRGRRVVAGSNSNSPVGPGPRMRGRRLVVSNSNSENNSPVKDTSGMSKRPRSPQWNFHNVPGDGQCLFHSVASGIFYTGLSIIPTYNKYKPWSDKLRQDTIRVMQERFNRNNADQVTQVLMSYQEALAATRKGRRETKKETAIRQALAGMPETRQDALGLVDGYFEFMKSECAWSGDMEIGVLASLPEFSATFSGIVVHEDADGYPISHGLSSVNETQPHKPAIHLLHKKRIHFVLMTPKSNNAGPSSSRRRTK